MKRYAVCKIIGDGLTPETAYRPAVADILDPQTGMRAFNVAQVMASNPDGTPKRPWALVVIAGPRMDLIANNQDVDLLPDVPLDLKIGSMQSVTKLKMAQALTARGIDMSGLGNIDGVRDLVRMIGQLHEQTFNEAGFDVSE